MRDSRENNEPGFFHIMVQGIRKEAIFKASSMKDIFIYYMKSAAEKYNVKIVAYCVMDNHAHILTYVDKIENLSKMMHIQNELYAIRYNKVNGRCGYVFRNRFKSESILDHKYLRNCIVYIHNNPVKAGICKNQRDYKYSSYGEYLDGMIDNEIIEKVFGKDCEYLLEIEKELELNVLFIGAEDDVF